MDLNQSIQNPLSFINFDPQKFKANHQINNVIDFIKYCELHRSRVFFIGLDILDKFSKEFSNVKKEDLSKYLLLHDESKVLRVKGEYIYAQRLFDLIYGRDVKNLSETLQDQAYKLIKEINNYDEKVIKKFINESNLFQVAAQLSRIEHIADTIDRGMNKASTHEFARPMQKASSLLNNEADKKIAKYYEQKSIYTNVIS
jgi:hypothetical protein